ncbi:MAG: hypothetical protein BMS9Abin09_0088 [Gammaproteobacteria bacterium]|nr:MAG: hypothetical protein BMS9Abin09_0088 [Gammaproteobacteria bacterium]
MSKSYTIKDSSNRSWGSFDVIGEQHGKIYGYLVVTADYSKVKQIFTDHDEAISRPDGDTSKTTEKILALGAYLIDNESGEKIDIGHIIFINENLLVTCEIKQDC